MMWRRLCSRLMGAVTAHLQADLRGNEWRSQSVQSPIHQWQKHWENLDILGKIIQLIILQKRQKPRLSSRLQLWKPSEDHFTNTLRDNELIISPLITSFNVKQSAVLVWPAALRKFGVFYRTEAREAPETWIDVKRHIRGDGEHKELSAEQNITLTLRADLYWDYVRLLEYLCLTLIVFVSDGGAETHWIYKRRAEREKRPAVTLNDSISQLLLTTSKHFLQMEIHFIIWDGVLHHQLLHVAHLQVSSASHRS